jgi:hypothetical protein
MRKVEALKNNMSWQETYDYNDRMVTPPSESLSVWQLEGTDHTPVDALCMTFLTPVLLKQKGRWGQPAFGLLIKRLRDRINALSYFYCNEPLEMDFREFGEKADAIRKVKEDIRWVEEKRFSKHRSLNHLLKGYMGKVEFEGELSPFMLMLRLGEFLHVGKATAFGQGWYKMEIFHGGAQSQ